MDDDFFLPITNLKYHSDDEIEKPGGAASNLADSFKDVTPSAGGNGRKRTLKRKLPRPVRVVSTPQNSEDRKEAGTTSDEDSGENSLAPDRKTEVLDETAAENLNVEKKKKRKTKSKKKKKETPLKKGTENKDEKKLGSGEEIFKCIRIYIKKGKAFRTHRLVRQIKFLKGKEGNEKEQSRNDRKIEKLMENIKLVKAINLNPVCYKFTAHLQAFLKTKTDSLEAEESNWIDVLRGCKDNDEVEVLCLNLLEMKGLKSSLESKLDVLMVKKKTESDFEKSGAIKDSSFNESDGCNQKLNAEQQNISKNDDVKDHQEGSGIETETNDHQTVQYSVCTTALEEKEEDECNTLKTLNDNEGVVHKREKTNNIKHKKSFKENHKNKKQNVQKSKVGSTGWKEHIEKGVAHGMKSNDFILRKYKQLIRRNGNRLGQRARRELWEKLYGGEATHVKKGIKIQRQGRPQRGSMDHKPKQRENKRNLHDSNSQHRMIKKKALETEKLHPSWQAKRIQKQQSNIVEFAGSKITFEE